MLAYPKFHFFKDLLLNNSLWKNPSFEISEWNKWNNKIERGGKEDVRMPKIRVWNGFLGVHDQPGLEEIGQRVVGNTWAWGHYTWSPSLYTEFTHLAVIHT